MAPIPISLDRLEPVLYVLAGAVAALAVTLMAYSAGPLAPIAVVGAIALAGFAAVRPLLTLYAALLIVPFKLYTVSLPGADLSTSEALLVLTGVAWAGRRLAGGEPPWVASPLNKPYAALLLAVVPGLLVAVHPFGVAKTLFMWTIFFFLYQLVVEDGRVETVQRLLLALAVAGALVGVMAFLQPAAQPEQLVGLGEEATGRVGGAFQDPNILATFQAMSLPAALVLALAGRPFMRPLGVVAFGLAAAGLALSLSRGGILAAAGALVAMLLWRPFRRAALVALVVVAGFVLTGSSVLGSVEQTQTLTGRVQSVSYAAQGADPRFEIWRLTPHIVESHPFFGVGSNQFPDVSLRYGIFPPTLGGSFLHAHNIPLTIAAELGLLGLAAFLWLVAALARCLVRAYRGLAGAERGLVAAVGAALVALAVQGMVDYTVSSNTITAVSFLLAGCAAVLFKRTREDVPQTAAQAVPAADR